MPDLKPRAKRLSPRALFAALLLLASAPALAQRPPRQLPPIPVTISGQVRHARGGQPVARAVVRLERNGEYVGEAKTDRAGKFRFTNLSPAQYVVTARSPGYTTARQQVDLQTASTEYVQLQLAPDEEGGARADAVAPPLALVDPNVPLEAQKEFERGRDAVMSRRLEEGLAYLRRAVRIYPNFYEAHLLTGTTLMDARRWEESEPPLVRASELNAKSAPARLALGEVYLRLKRLDDAERVLREALKLDSRSAQGYFTLGRVHWERGDYVKAGPEVGRALRLRPDFAEAHLLAGNILLRARQAENALAEFQEYLRLAPEGEFAPQVRQMVRKIEQALARKP